MAAYPKAEWATNFTSVSVKLLLRRLCALLSACVDSGQRSVQPMMHILRKFIGIVFGHWLNWLTTGQIHCLCHVIRSTKAHSYPQNYGVR